MFYVTMTIMISCLFHLSILSMDMIKYCPENNKPIAPKSIQSVYQKINPIQKKQNDRTDNSTLAFLTKVSKNINTFSSFFEPLSPANKHYLLDLTAPTTFNSRLLTTKIYSTLDKGVQSALKKTIWVIKNN